MILIIGGMGFIGLNTALRFVEVGEKIGWMNWVIRCQERSSVSHRRRAE